MRNCQLLWQATTIRTRPVGHHQKPIDMGHCQGLYPKKFLLVLNPRVNPLKAGLLSLGKSNGYCFIVMDFPPDGTNWELSLLGFSIGELPSLTRNKKVFFSAIVWQLNVDP